VNDASIHHLIAMPSSISSVRKRSFDLWRYQIHCLSFSNHLHQVVSPKSWGMSLQSVALDGLSCTSTAALPSGDDTSQPFCCHAYSCLSWL
jgi:hypothetical protein